MTQTRIPGLYTNAPIVWDRMAFLRPEFKMGRVDGCSTKTSQRFHKNVNVSDCTITSTFSIFIGCVRHESVPTGRDRKLDGRETGCNGALDGREQNVLDRITCMATWADGNKRVNVGMGTSDYTCTLHCKSDISVVGA